MASFPRSPDADYRTFAEISKRGGPPALGFFPAVAAGFAMQSTIHNTYGNEFKLRELERENQAKVKEAGFDVATLEEGPDGTKLSDINIPIPIIGPLSDILGISALTEFRPYTAFQRASYDADAYQSTGEDEGRIQATRRARARTVTASRDEIIAKAAAARPDLGIMGYDAMRAEVMRRGQEINAFAETRGSVGANIGGFIGEMIGFFDPSTSPLAPLTLGAGGAGRTTAMRIMSQFGFNAGIETVEQLSGVRENMQWFGLNPTAMDTLIQIGLAGAIPAGLHGLGEAAIGRAGRAALNRPAPTTPYARRQKIWKVAPGAEGPAQYDRAIGPEPMQDYPRLPERGFARVPTAEEVVLDQMGVTRVQRPYAGADLDHTARGGDVWGATPNDLLPPTRQFSTATSVVPEPRGWQGPGMDDLAPQLPDMWQSIARGHDVTIDEVARMLSPEPFNRIDQLAKQIKETQAQLSRATALAGERTSMGRMGQPETRKAIQDLIAALGRAKTDEGRAKIEAQITALQAAQEAGGPVPKGFNVDELAAKLLGLQEKQREQFPLAERAMAHAQGRWDLANSDKELFAEWYYQQQGLPAPKRKKPPLGERIVTLTQGPSHPKEYAEGTPDIPHLRDPIAAEGPRNELAMDTVTRVSEARAKEAADINDDWADTIAKALSEVDEAVQAGKVPWYRDPEIVARGDEQLSFRGAIIKNGKIIGYQATAGELPPGAIEIPTLPNGQPISDLANEKMNIDGEEMTVREFFQRYEVDEELASSINTCATNAGFGGLSGSS